jgi:hypothetical protein
MDEGAVEAAFRAAGLQMRSKEQLGSELMEWVEEHEGRASRELMRLARMLRKQEYYQEIRGGTRELPLGDLHPPGKTSPDPVRPAKNRHLVRCKQGNDLLYSCASM